MSTAGGRITASAGSNLIGVHAADRNQEATIYVGNIDVQANEELIWELFVQGGPVGERGSRARTPPPLQSVPPPPPPLAALAPSPSPMAPLCS